MSNALLNALNKYAPQPVSNWFGELATVANRADGEAERRFPNQERDSSIKNAYRHALGAGGLAQLLGSTRENPILSGAARGAAKLAGYWWEDVSGPENWGSQDSLHDLNANAHGIAQSTQAKDFRSLAESLESFSRSAREESPPQFTDKARPYFTYTK